MSGHVVRHTELGAVELVTIAGALLDNVVQTVYRVTVPRADGLEAHSLLLTAQELADLEILAGDALLETPAGAGS